MPCLVQNYSYTPCPRLSEKLGEIAETLGVFWVKYGIKRAQLHRHSIIGHEIKIPIKATRISMESQGLLGSLRGETRIFCSCLGSIRLNSYRKWPKMSGVGDLNGTKNQ